MSSLAVEIVATLRPRGLEGAQHITTWRPRLPRGRALRTPALSAHTLAPLPAHRAGRAVRFELGERELVARVAFPAGTSFYGTGEVAGPLRRNGRTVRLWNSDAYGYDGSTPALYQSHPLVLAVQPDGACTIAIADTLRRGVIRCGDRELELRFEGNFDVHLVSAADPLAVLRAATAWTGRIDLPPRWALGYHQCRFSYGSAAEALAVARELRARRIPCTALWLDIDAMQRFRPFTWDPRRFPDPAGLIEELHTLDLRVVAILDPGLPRAAGYEPYESGLAGGHFMADARGSLVRARVWPGPCHFPDFSRAATRAWWARLVERYVRASGLDGLWIDMNEPAAFDTPTRTLPEESRHRGLGGGDHARFHNAYGMWMARATRAGLHRVHRTRRSFVLTRSNHLAGSRYAATWTGDNRARWEDLRGSVAMILNLGLSGQPFAGPDVGGFDGDPDPELFQRWFELATFYPFARGHAEKSSCRKEPWAFGPAAEKRVRAALERRASWLPTLRSLFAEAHATGAPVWRPLWFADPHDARLRDVDDAFLFGPDVLVAPVLRRRARRRSLRLPAGRWFPWDGGPPLAGGRAVEVAAPLGVTPVFVRAGAIVFTAGGEPDEEGDLVWNVYLDARARARGRLLHDRGEGRDARTGELRCTARVARGELHLSLRRRGPERPPPGRRRVVLHGAPGRATAIVFETAPARAAERLALARGAPQR